MISTGDGSQRYRFVQAPMGLNASVDEFCRRTDDAFGCIPGVSKLVDDILVQADIEDLLIAKIDEVLQKSREHGVTISKSKMQQGSSVKFAGYVIRAMGQTVEVLPDPGLLSKLREFPEPTCVTELQSFLGKLGQIADWSSDLAQHSMKMRVLLKWLFTPAMRLGFANAKQGLVDPGRQRLHPFNPSLHCIVLRDASCLHGLGFLLIQEDGDGRKRIIKCESVSLKPAEKNYSITELEGLVVWYACHKSDYFLLGQDFDVYTDHRALEGVFNKEIREVDNIRLQKLCIKMMQFDVNIKYVHGKYHYAADALSRWPGLIL